MNLRPHTRTACAVRLMAALLSLLPLAGRAQFLFITNNDTITITGYNGPGGNVTIPEVTNGYEVTAVGDYAFATNQTLTQISTPNSILSVGNYAFADCQYLTSFSFGDGVQTLGTGAFMDCYSLYDLSFSGESLVSWGDYCFANDDSLNGGFSLGTGTTNVGVGAFEYCHLYGVEFQSRIMNIGQDAFFANDLTSITVDPSDAYYTTVNGILFNKNLTTLVQYPQALTGSYTVSNTVTSIANDAFAGSYYLSSVQIPGTVTNIGAWAFRYCDNLTNLTVDPSNPDYLSVNGVLLNHAQTALIQYPVGSAAASYTVSNGVTSLDDFAFADSGLAAVTLPNSVTNIGYEEFAYDEELTNLTFGTGVDSIGDYAFFECALTNVVIPPGVTSIGNGVFSECYDLSGLTLTAAITSIGTYAFYSCFALTNVTIPASVTNLEDYAFDDCFGLAGIYFGGNAPGADSTVFQVVPATAYYLPGTAGWTAFSTATGLSIAPWLPQIQSSGPGFGIRTNRFGFNINWVSGQTVVVQAAANLANPVWVPVSTNIFAGATSYFSDAAWTNYPRRFYRLSSP